jgi:hypothetical protein
MVRNEGGNVKFGQWTKVCDQLPPDDEPVLLLVNGTIYEGMVTWEQPGFEDTHKPFRYFIDTDESCDWEWHDVTHWMIRPLNPPKESA